MPTRGITRKCSTEWGFEPDFVASGSQPRKTTGSSAASGSRDRRKSGARKGECWLVKHAPQCRSELAVHKKKVEDVSRVLSGVLSHQSRHRVLVLSGPTGVGKSATVRALARDLGVSLEEWSNPVMTYDAGLPYESEMSKFKGFLLSSSKYSSVMGGDPKNNNRGGKKLVLIEELPFFVWRHQPEFWEIIATYSRSASSHPLVIILSDSSSSSLRVPPQLLNISFNAVASTIMTKALKAICQKEGVSDASVADIVAQCSGDLRAAVLSLRFHGQPTTGRTAPPERGKRRKVARKEAPKTFGKDTNLFLFHALGKLLYAKRVEDAPADCSTIPELARRPLEFSPEDTVDRCPLSGDLLTQYLHHNYPGFHESPESVLTVSDSLCDVDRLLTFWRDDGEVTRALGATAKYIAARSVCFAKDPSITPKFTPLCGPVQREIERTKKETTELARGSFSLHQMCDAGTFFSDTAPFLKKIGYRGKNSAEYQLIQRVSSYKTGPKSGQSLPTKGSAPETFTDVTGESVSCTGRQDEEELARSAELEAEIGDFSD